MDVAPAAPLWDYLIVTASNDAQGRIYDHQLKRRREAGLLQEARQVLVLADPGGKRIGSGGSTLCCLARVIQAERSRGGPPREPEEILGPLRILIVHAGGDSKRLPAYGPCGKIFVPLPGGSGSPLGWTLFDRAVSILRQLPPPENGKGQTVVVSGDALLLFDPRLFRPAEAGVTALGNLADMQAASRHGVYCTDDRGRLRLYLQKPSPEEQRRYGAVGPQGKTVMDLGLMSFDAATAALWLEVFEFAARPDGSFLWSDAMGEVIGRCGLDIYREICCAMGMETDQAFYLRAVRSSGSHWEEDLLLPLFRRLQQVPMQVLPAPECRFLHFGTSRQLQESGLRLLEHDGQPVPVGSVFLLNSRVKENGKVTGTDSWVEGCRIAAPLTLGGRNLLVGADVDHPLRLPPEFCLDVLAGNSRRGEAVHFIRCYGLRDSFKETVAQGTLYCGRPLADWLAAMEVEPAEIGPEGVAPDKLTLWEARIFPAEIHPDDFSRWLWMAAPETASREQKKMWRDADRYSASEIALFADQEKFHERRVALRQGRTS